MLDMKGSLELEYIAKLAILLVVIFVMITLLFYFSGKIEILTGLLFPGKATVQTKYVSKKGSVSFSANEVNNYIRTCWAKTGKNYDSDAVCYVLNGDFISLKQPPILKKVDGGKVETRNTNPMTKVVLVRFKNLDDEIIVEGSD